MSRCDFENYQISAQDTVGVAGDDIMFYILVELERRSKAQNVGNANGYRSGLFNFRWNVCRELKKSGHFANFEISNTASIWPQIWKDRPDSCV